jgi:hypothetical protein
VPFEEGLEREILLLKHLCCLHRGANLREQRVRRLERALAQ